MKKIIVGIAVIILIIAEIFYFGKNSNQTANKEPIKIGVIAPLTGNAAELGEHIQRGLTLANERLSGKYSFVYEDDKCFDTVSAISAAQKLSGLDKVKHVIGPLCAPAYQAVTGIFNNAGVSFMHTSAVTKPFIDSSGKMGIPGLSTTLSEEDAALVNFVFNTLGLRKIGVFVWNEEWAVEHRNNFVRSFTEMGGQIVFDEKFDIGSFDFRTQIKRMENSGAEGVFVVALNFQNGNIVKQMDEIGTKLKIFGQFEIEDPVFLKHAGKGADGVYYVYPEIMNTEESNAFIAAYKEKYDTEPNYYSYIGYDSLKLYDYAINQCGITDSKCATDAILAAKDFSGVSGLITFTSNKELSRSFVIKTIRDGKFVVVE